MLTFVFLAFVALFAVGGIFIAMQAKRRKGGGVPRPSVVAGDSPTVGRATPGDN